MEVTSALPENIQGLYDALSSSAFNSTLVNAALEKLIADVHLRNPYPSQQPCNEWLNAIKYCCAKITPDYPLLLAKCANILLALVNMRHVILTPNDLDLIVSWACKCLSTGPDIVYLDFLQMLDSILQKEQNYFSTKGQELLNVLTSKLEDNVSVSLPQYIVIWRLSCLKRLSTCLPTASLPTIAASYLGAALSLKQDGDKQLYCQVLIKVLDGFDALFLLSPEWIHPVLPHLILVIYTAMTTGLNMPASPNLQFPGPLMLPQPEEVHPKRQKGKLKKKNKTRIKQVPWAENDYSNICGDNNKQLNVEIISWRSSSDSEMSDSEAGMVQRTKKLEAHVRHSAYNVFIQLVKIIGCKPLFEWHSALFSRLIDAARMETYCKPRCAVFGALTVFLSGSKMFLAQAQQNERKSFTSFSEMLGEQLAVLHSVVAYSLKNISLSDQQQLTALFSTTVTLIKVTPYHRLDSKLFGTVYDAIQPFTSSNDPYVVSCVLKCTSEVVLITPVNEGISNIISTPKNTGETSPLLLEYAFSHLSEDVNGIRVFAWDLISGLCRYHFKLVKPHVAIIEKRISLELTCHKPVIHPLKALTSLMGSYMEDCDYISRASDLWDILLQKNSAFLQALQEPGNSGGVAYDCLSLIGARKFHMLTEDKKILIITLVFSSCCHELQIVRFAAINTLSNFLAYPQMSEEIQFVCDAKDHLIRAMKDSVESVRVRAAWAFGNLVDLLVQSKDDDLIAEINIFDLFEAGLSLSSDTQKVKQNIVRAIGHILLLVSHNDLGNPKWNAVLDNSCTMLQQCASSGSLMKMRWNACYALAVMFSNEILYDALESLAPDLIRNLCTIVTGCCNFKVRMNACLAVSSIKQRKLYGTLFFFVWQSLLEGLDNSANMPDFSEFKHQHGLLQNLCSAICHMACFIEVGDLTELKDILESRLDVLYSHLQQCQERTTPEQAGTLLKATKHVEAVATESNNVFAKKLLIAFQVSQI